MLDVDPIAVVSATAGPEPADATPTVATSPSQLRLGYAQLNKELRASEARYRMLFEAIDEGFCIIEQVQGQSGEASDFRYVEANPAFKKQSGLNDVVGKTIRQILPGECEEWIATYDSIVESGQGLRFERGLIGQGRVLELYAFPVGEAKHLRVGVSFKDVTERKRSEELLRRNRDIFFNLVENAPFGLYVVDAQLRLGQVSKAAQKAFSLVVSLIGRELEEVLRCSLADRSVSETMMHFRHTLVTGEPYAAPNAILARQDSLEIKSYDWKIERITMPDGQFGVACYFYDITERMQAQETLRQSEERFRALFDRGPVAIYSVDASGAIQEFNAVAAQFWGQEPNRADASGRFCGAYRLYLPDGTPLPHELTPIAKVLNGQLAEALDVEMVIERPDRSRLTVIANIVPLRNSQGVITGAINCFYDITERKRLESETQQQAAALKEQDRRKNEFLAMLSHELRNPLAPIMNAVHLLGMQTDEAPHQRKPRQVIERQVQQLKLLIDDLLDVSRISSGRVQLKRMPVTLRSVLERAVETVQPMTAQRQHEVVVSLPLQDVWLHADAARLEQVVVNLLTNATKYSDVSGHIWVTACVEDTTLFLSVRDEGIGIAPELLPHVFDLFTQAERSLDRAQGGLGVGLCLVQRLVELHGGNVQACSVLGQGSEFIVQLPVMASLPMPSMPQLLAVEEAAMGPVRRRVLVVDDNADIAETLKYLIEMDGHEVQVANDGHQTLAVASSFRPDVMLLDIGLPGVSGLEVARQLRKQPAFDKMVLVAMTGYGQQSDRDLTSAAGFDHHLVKPADFESVQKILACKGRTTIEAAELSALLK
jgi:PAS domain S-box-containing protein